MLRVLLSLMGWAVFLILTVHHEDARSNISSWLEAIGLPAFDAIRNPVADDYAFWVAIGLIALGAMLPVVKKVIHWLWIRTKDVFDRLSARRDVHIHQHHHHYQMRQKTNADLVREKMDDAYRRVTGED